MHKPVMLEEALEYLNPRPGDVILDATLGNGGHAKEILNRIGPGGRLLAMDQDQEAIDRAKTNLGRAGNITIAHSNFSAIDLFIRSVGVPGINGALFDFGVSSNQLDTADRGFSFAREGPLDMRMDRSADTTAADLVNGLPERELADLFFRFGEERRSRIIARKIVENRKKSAFQTTFDLAELIKSCYPRSPSRIHPATRVFQALRIAVNRELESIEEGIKKVRGHVLPGGRVVVISFHSLEDRIAKLAFRQAAAEGEYRILTKKVVTPGDTELAENPRSRSAKLRAIERVTGDEKSL